MDSGELARKGNITMSELDDILFALDTAAMGSVAPPRAPPAVYTTEQLGSRGGVNGGGQDTLNVAAAGGALWNVAAVAPRRWLDPASVRPLPGLRVGCPAPSVAAESAR